MWPGAHAGSDHSCTLPVTTSVLRGKRSPPLPQPDRIRVRRRDRCSRRRCLRRVRGTPSRCPRCLPAGGGAPVQRTRWPGRQRTPVLAAHAGGARSELAATLDCVPLTMLAWLWILLIRRTRAAQPRNGKRKAIFLLQSIFVIARRGRAGVPVAFQQRVPKGDSHGCF